MLRSLDPDERVVAPSDLTKERTDIIRIGGRVALRETNALVVADAFSRVRVELADPSEADVGNFVVVIGICEDGHLEEAAVEWMAQQAPPRDSGEVARLQKQGVIKHLTARAEAVRIIRQYFSTEHFLEVDTPSMVPCPGLDVHLDAFEIAAPHPPSAAFLITSPEYQMKRLLAGGIPRCFQIAHCFRRGEVGAHHNPEFSMVEWYRAFADVKDVMRDTEEIVRWVTEALNPESRGVIEVRGRRMDMLPPYERLSVRDAFERYAGISGDAALTLAEQNEEKYFRVLAFEIEPKLAELPKPIFLFDYPSVHASLARNKPGDPRVCERFELYAAGIELCNGFGELTDPLEQRERFERDQAARARMGKPVYPIDERLLAALEEGMPPASGNALGLDRLLALVTGAESVGTVQAFPVDWL